MLEPMYSITDYEVIGGISVELRVALTDDFNSQVGGKLENFGDLKIRSVSLDNEEECFWDNLNFFLNASKEEIKSECKKELIEKNLFGSGIFKLINQMLKPFVKRGFLKVNKGKNY